jgi:modification methylase
LLSQRGGLLRTDEVWKALGRACALRGAGVDVPRVLLTSQLPRRRSEGDRALRAAGPAVLFDVVDMLTDDGPRRLRRYATGGAPGGPQPGFWTAPDIAAAGSPR